MTSNPRPRQALRRSPDHSVHPAAPRLVPIQAELTAPAKPAKKGKTPKPDKDSLPGKRERGPAEDKSVDLVVPIPKSLRKRLKAKAEEHGFTPEEAAYHLLRVWVDG